MMLRSTGLEAGSLRRVAALAVLAAAALLLLHDAQPAVAQDTLPDTIPTPELTPIPGDGAATITWEHPLPGRQLYAAGTWRDLPNSWSGVFTFDLPADGSKTSHTFTGLTNGKTYEFRFHLIDRPALEINDAIAFTRVTVGAPQAPVVSVSPLRLGGDLNVTWDDPEDNGAAITGYEVEYKKSDAETWEDDEVSFPDGHTRTARIDGLEAGEQYEVRVRAENSRGTGPWSQPATGTTLPLLTGEQGEGDTFSVSDVTVVEGGTANITVTLSNTAPSGGVAFTAAASYSTTGTGNAVAADVHSVAGSLTIAQGDTTGTLAVRARKDTADEGAETFTVSVTTTDPLWTPEDNRATVTIHDPVRFPPLTDNPSESRAGIGVTPESDNITLYFKVGQAASVEFPAAHDGTGETPYVYALGGPERDYQRASRRALPGGLTFNATTRTLSGTPTGVDGNGVTTLGSDRIIHYHVWDDSGAGGPDGDDNTSDNHDELRVRIHICPADSAATADGATACVKTAELYSLEVSHGDPATPVTLSPAFDRDTGTYTATVAEAVDAVDISVLPEGLNADRVKMTVNGEEFETDTSGRKFTGEAALTHGANVIEVEVTSGTSPAHEENAQGERIPATATYTVTVTRASDDPVLQFGSATYIGTEGDTITIQLSLSEAQSEDFRVWVRSDLRSAADFESDFSFGDCLTGEGSCEFGIGVLDVTIPAGDTTYDYDIRTVDDHRVEESETFTLDLAYIGSPFALGANGRAVVTIVDNDEAGVIVSTETVSMKEETTGNEESNATYTIRLESQPDDWVRVYPESAFSCKVGVIRGFVEFSRHNWDQPQTVRLRAEHDFDAVDEEVVISHRIEAASRAAEYRAVTVPPVTVSVDDKHMPALIVTKSSLTPLPGETVSYRVHLSADPAPIYGANPADCHDYSSSHTVIITPTSSDTEKVTISPASVTFTADDFDPKTFYVTGVSAGDVTITHAVTGTDPAYTGEPLVLQQIAISVPAQQKSAQEPPSSPQTAPEPEGVQEGPLQARWWM